MAVMQWWGSCMIPFSIFVNVLHCSRMLVGRVKVGFCWSLLQGSGRRVQCRGGRKEKNFFSPAAVW